MIAFIMQARTGEAYVLRYDPAAHRLFRDGLEIRPGRRTSPAPRGLQVRLALGKGCNFACAYCHQSKGRPDTPARADLAAQIARLAGERCVESVQFWGGEPLLYFDVIKGLHAALCRALPQQPEFSLCTNGALLHGERLEWILANRIRVMLSWDGPGQSLRGRDVLAEPTVRRAVRRLVAAQPELVGVSPVMTRKNRSHADYVAALGNRLGTDALDLGEAKPVMIVDEPSRRCAIPAEGLPAYSRRLHLALVGGRLPMFGQAHQMAAMWRQRLGEPVARRTMAKCFVSDPLTLCLDLAGNILTCQAFAAEETDAYGEPHCLGRIDALPVGALVPLPALTGLAARQVVCGACPVYALCRGGCPFGPEHAVQENCRAQGSHLLPVVGLALHGLTGDVLTEVQGWDKIRG